MDELNLNSLRRKLEKATYPVDNELLWSQVSERLPQRKKKKFLIYFIFGILMGGLAFLLLKNLSENPEFDNHTMAQNDNEDCPQSVSLERMEMEKSTENVLFNELIFTKNPISEERNTSPIPLSKIENDKPEFYDSGEAKILQSIEHRNSGIHFSRPLIPVYLLPNNPKESPNQFTHYIESQSSILNVNRNLYVDNENDIELLNSRKTTEKELFAVDLSAKYSILHRSGFYAGVGMEYLRIAEQKSYYSVLSDSVGIDDKYIQREVVLDNGMKQTLYGSSEVHYQKIGVRRIINSLNFLNLGLTLGYRKQINRIAMFAEVDYEYNLFLKFNGNISNNVDYKEQMSFKTKIEPYLTYRLGLDYALCDKWRIGLAFKYVKINDNVNEDSYPVNQKYNLMGVSTSLNYSL